MGGGGEGTLKVGGGGEGTLKLPWSLRGTDNPEGPVVKGIGSSVSFSCSFKLNLNQGNVSKLLERAWNEGGERVEGLERTSLETLVMEPRTWSAVTIGQISSEQLP